MVVSRLCYSVGVRPAWGWLPGVLRPVLEVPPFVVVAAVQVVPVAVPLEPAGPAGRPHVEGDTHDVGGFLGREHPAAGGRDRAGAADLRGEQPVLLGGVPVAGGEADQLAVPPERLGAGGGERGPRGM